MWDGFINVVILRVNGRRRMCERSESFLFLEFMSNDIFYYYLSPFSPALKPPLSVLPQGYAIDHFDLISTGGSTSRPYIPNETSVRAKTHSLSHPPPSLSQFLI